MRETATAYKACRCGGTDAETRKLMAAERKRAEEMFLKDGIVMPPYIGGGCYRTCGKPLADQCPECAENPR